MFVLIKGVKFKVQILTKEKYIRLHKDKSYAHFDKEKRDLVFRKDHVSKKIVVHEVCHAFISTLCLSSCSDLTIDDFEEIVCELMEDHLMDINRISNQIVRFLKE